MLRLLAAFVVLFAGAAACVSLLPSPPTVLQPHAAVASPLQAEAGSPKPAVRVVYPGPGTAVTPGTTTAAAETTVAADAGRAPASGTSLGVASAAGLYPQVQPAAADPSAPAVPVNAAVQAGAPGVNLNTASIETLNQIPGAGRIGRTIASHRPYRSVEELLTKHVIKRSVYDRIKDQVAAE